MPPPTILPNSFAILLLPNKTSKLVRVTPNSTISLGKFGSFPTNALLHRPYHLTFDILDEPGQNGLSLVSTEELTRDLLGEQEAEAAQEEEGAEGSVDPTIAIAAAESTVIVQDDSGLDDVRNNRETVDDPNTQKLSWAEIEELKRSSGMSGKEIISALMKSHANIHQKTAYSLGKYALRKRSKYLKRFTVKPIDVSTLLDYLVSEKEASRVMEMRQEGLALMLSLGNVRYCPDVNVQYVDSTGELKDEIRRGGRWLVVDETGGLLVAAVAERLGLLEYEPTYLNDDEELGYSDEELDGEEEEAQAVVDNDEPPTKKAKISHTGVAQPTASSSSSAAAKPTGPTPRRRHPAPATSNTITLIHPNEQPNLSLLKHFQYDPNNPPPSHPLHTHLRTISYLSLLSPSSDPYLAAPERLPDTVFRSYKSGKKSAYLRKWRRWERNARTVLETRAGGFDGLLVASWMDVKGVLAHLAPLVRGSGQIVVWRPDREALVQVVDACGKEMKGEWLKRKDAELDALSAGSGVSGAGASTEEVSKVESSEAVPVISEDITKDSTITTTTASTTTTTPPHPSTNPASTLFDPFHSVPNWSVDILPHLPATNLSTAYYLTSTSPTVPAPEPDITTLLRPHDLPDLLPEVEAGVGGVMKKKDLDPTILLAPTIHYTQVRTYQVLPGRTHPVMTSRGGAEGYVFVATRVLPVEGKVEARGKGGKVGKKGGRGRD